MITGSLRDALRRYGSTVTIINGQKSETAKAFIQPLRRRMSPYINERLIPAGYFDRTYRLYIGDRIHKVKTNVTTVCCKGTEYTVIADEEYLVGGEPVYRWAILRPKNPIEEDDYDVTNR